MPLLGFLVYFGLIEAEAVAVSYQRLKSAELASNFFKLNEIIAELSYH